MIYNNIESMDYSKYFALLNETKEEKIVETEECPHLFIIDITHQVCKKCGLSKDLDLIDNDWNQIIQTQQTECFAQLGTYIGNDTTGKFNSIKRIQVWGNSKSKNGRGFLNDCAEYINKLCEEYKIPNAITDAVIYEIRRIYVKEKHCFRGKPKIGRFIYFIIACAFQKEYYNFDILDMLRHCDIKINNYNKGLECLEKVDNDLPLYYIPTNILTLLKNTMILGREISVVELIKRFNIDMKKCGKTRHQNIGKITVFKILNEIKPFTENEIEEYIELFKISYILLSKY